MGQTYGLPGLAGRWLLLGPAEVREQGFQEPAGLALPSPDLSRNGSSADTVSVVAPVCSRPGNVWATAEPSNVLISKCSQ